MQCVTPVDNIAHLRRHDGLTGAERIAVDPQLREMLIDRRLVEDGTRPPGGLTKCLAQDQVTEFSLEVSSLPIPVCIGNPVVCWRNGFGSVGRKATDVPQTHLPHVPAPIRGDPHFVQVAEVNHPAMRRAGLADKQSCV